MISDNDSETEPEYREYREHRYTFANISVGDFTVQNFNDFKTGLMMQFQGLKFETGFNNISYLDPPRCDRVSVVPFGRAGAGTLTVAVTARVECADALLARRSFEAFGLLITDSTSGRFNVLRNPLTGRPAPLRTTRVQQYQLQGSCYTDNITNPSGALESFMRSLVPTTTLAPTPASQLASSSSGGPSSGTGWIVAVLVPIICVIIIIVVVVWRVRWYVDLRVCVCVCVCVCLRLCSCV